LFVIATSSVATAAAQACWEEAAARYGVSAQLLYAVAKVESGLNQRAVNLSHFARTGTYDIGLMQINSSNLPSLARFGINEADLYDTCTNINVGAWLLARKFSEYGASWEGVGAYNAACTQLKGEACAAARRRYAWRVYEHLPSAAGSMPLDRRRFRAAGASSVIAQAHPVYILSARVSP
jgi:soluble lytic murein transglycosylase-like protein